MFNVKVKVYNGVKYEATSEKVAEIKYKNIKGYEVVTGDRATEIGLETDENRRDEYNEYLIITLENGDTMLEIKYPEKDIRVSLKVR